MAAEAAGQRPTDDPFAELVLWLAEDRAHFDRDVKTADPDQDDALDALRRQYAMSALAHVVQFLNHPTNLRRCPDILRWNLDFHLRDLHDALGEVEDGRAPGLLRAKGKKGTSRKESAFKGRVAAIAEVLHRAGAEYGRADAMVATALRRASYGTPRRRAHRHISSDCGDITERTVYAWRKEARERPAYDVLRATYERIVDRWAAPGTARSELRRVANALMSGLAAEVPSKGMRKLSLIEDTTAEK